MTEQAPDDFQFITRADGETAETAVDEVLTVSQEIQDARAAAAEAVVQNIPNNGSKIVWGNMSLPPSQDDRLPD
jgi:hypothetical protein